jgi:hypothetical protein
MSQSGILNVENSNPQIPTSFQTDSGIAIPIANQLELLGEVVANAGIPFRSIGSGNTVTYQVQYAEESLVSDATLVGVAAFDSSAFNVDANGFVTLNGGGGATTNMDVDDFLAPGTDPVVPDGSGNIVFTGGQVAAGTVGANVIRSYSGAANTVAMQIQRSTSSAVTDSTKNGVSHFNSAEFLVDANGFVSLAGSGLAIDSFQPDSGTNPVVPTAGGLVVMAGSGSITTVGSLNTLTTQLTGLTNHAVLVGAGTTTITKLAVGTNGQVLIGATGADPAFGTITSTDGSIDFTLGANTLNMAASDATKTPIGAMAYFGTLNSDSYPNPTWLECDGSVVSQADYPTLYSRIGLVNEVGTNFVNNAAAAIVNTQIGIAYGNGVFVSVGNAGSIYTTLDGLTYTSRTSGTASTLRAVTYGNGIYVAGGNGGVVLNSLDGITWTIRTSTTTSSIFSLTYGGGIFVLSTLGGGLATSTDGTTWTARTSGTASNINQIDYLNSLYVFCGLGGALSTSTDAITWNAQSVGTTSTLSAVWYANSLYQTIATFNGVNVFFTSTDAVTWKRPRQPYKDTYNVTGTPMQALNVNGTYLLIGTVNYGTSTNGTTFQLQSIENTQLSNPPSWAAWNQDKLVVGIGSSGRSFTSSVYSYNTATSFKLPTEYYYNQLLQDNTRTKLFIKAL